MKQQKPNLQSCKDQAETLFEEQFHACEACHEWQPVDSFSGVRLDVYVPYGIVEGVRDDDSRDERDSGGVKLHYLFAVCAECRHSRDFEAWKLKARRRMLDEYCRTCAERRHPTHAIIA